MLLPKNEENKETGLCKKIFRPKSRTSPLMGFLLPKMSPGHFLRPLPRLQWGEGRKEHRIYDPAEPVLTFLAFLTDADDEGGGRILCMSHTVSPE